MKLARFTPPNPFPVPPAMGYAALALWALYLWLLPTAHTIALRNLAFTGLLGLTLWSIWKHRLRLSLPLPLPWLLYAGVALFSLAHTADIQFSLKAFRGEIVNGVLAFILATAWFRSESAYRDLLAIFTLANALVVGSVIYKILIVDPFWLYPSISLFNGTLINSGTYRDVYNGVGNLSTYLITLFPFVAVYALASPLARAWRTALFVLLALNVITVFISANRMGMIVLGMEIFLFGIFLITRLKVKLKGKALAVGLMALLMIAVMLVKQMQTRSPDHDPRWHIWSVAIQYIVADPWIGKGLGRIVMTRSNPEFVSAINGLEHAHNMLLNKALQMGIPGATAFLLLFGTTTLALWPRRTLHAEPTRWAYASAATVMSAGVFLKNMTDDFFVDHLSLLYWILAGATLGRLKETPAISRILVIHVTRIGDTLLTTPVPRALAAAWPQAEITFIGHPKRVEVMEHLPFISRVQGMTKLSAPFRGWFKDKPYDLAVVFGFDRALVKYALRVAKKVVAFRQEDDALNRRLYRIAGDGPRPRHAVPYLLEMLKPLDIPTAGLHLSYQVGPEETEWATQTLGEQLHTHPLIGLQVASFPTKGFRDWPVEHFVALCERIRDKYPGAHFLIFGGPLEKERTEALHRHFADCSTLFAGRLTLRQTAALMARLDLYVGVDTGPTHIMGALHRPLVALYHATSPSTALGPLEHPCFFPVDHPRAGQNPTVDTPMGEIDVDTVWKRVQEALAYDEPHWKEE